MKPAQLFSFDDAWLLSSLFMHGPEKTAVDLRAILAAGDYLNQAVFALRELRQGFEHLQTGGWIEIDGSQLCLTEKAVTLREEVLRSKGGLFSLVERTLKAMNKVQLAPLDHPDTTVSGCDFLTSEKLLQASLSYMSGLESTSDN